MDETVTLSILREALLMMLVEMVVDEAGKDVIFVSPVDSKTETLIVAGKGVVFARPVD